ncbi:MAG: hypothetical protein DMG37_17865 [Acidobacteria bacterium]|nr:MAG: hypothetical protein DMG37_17865 [Acidobacteriota bacterium]
MYFDEASWSAAALLPHFDCLHHSNIWQGSKLLLMQNSAWSRFSMLVLQCASLFLARGANHAETNLHQRDCRHCRDTGFSAIDAG